MEWFFIILSWGAVSFLSLLFFSVYEWRIRVRKTPDIIHELRKEVRELTTDKARLTSMYERKLAVYRNWAIRSNARMLDEDAQIGLHS